MNTDNTLGNISALPQSIYQTSEQHPMLFKLIKKLSTTPCSSFFDFSDDFEKLLSADFFSFAIPKEISALQQKEYYQLPLHDSDVNVKGWSMINTHYFRLTTFSFTKNGKQSHLERGPQNHSVLKIVSNDTLLYFAKSEGSVLDIYEISDELDTERACQSIVLKSSVALNDGAMVKLEAGRHAVHFRLIKDDMLYHELSCPESDVKVIGEYDPTSLQLVNVSVANLSSSRAEMFAETVANMKHKSSISVLEKLAAHADYFVRWNAALNLYTLDCNAGFQLIHKLTEDPNPNVKATAQRCCEMLFEQH
jgi:hypothetical protein